MNDAMIIIVIGFMLASFSVVANDSIQTLGTFLHSNSHRKWWVLWLFSSTVMVGVMVYGWANYHGDVSYDRLDKVYSKMVDFKGAQKALESVSSEVDYASKATIDQALVDIEEGIAASKKIYLSDNTKLESHVATYESAFDVVRVATENVDVPENVREQLKLVLEKGEGTVESMLGHRHVGDFIKWYYVIPPIVLLLLTQFGFPVSTSFLILITFQPGVLKSMLIKSVSGYFLAFGVAILIYLTVMNVLERKWRASEDSTHPGWVVAQWLSTAFLWSMWLIQDMANIFVYMPRPLPVVGLVFAIVWMVSVQALIYYNRGGRIQQIVTSKTNTQDIRSATIVDLLYGLVLYYFKIQNNVPMSTTWVFIGLLAGREFAFSFTNRKGALSFLSASKLMGKDLFKVIIGLLVSIGLAYLVRIFD